MGTHYRGTPKYIEYGQQAVGYAWVHIGTPKYIEDGQKVSKASRGGEIGWLQHNLLAHFNAVVLYSLP